MQVSFFSRTVCLVGIALFWSSCQDNAPTESRYEKIATAYCECTAQLAVLNRQAASIAADTTKQANLTEYFQQMQTEYNKAKECSTSIVAQFGHLKVQELDAVEKILTTKCPDLTGQHDLLQEMLGE